MYDPTDFFDTKRVPSYARQSTPILFGHTVFIDDDALGVRGTHDSRLETDKIHTWLKRLHGEPHNMYTEAVEPGRVWIDAHHGEYQFMWPADATSFQASMMVVRSEAQYDSSWADHQRTFPNFITGTRDEPTEEQYTVQQVREWVSEHCGISGEPGQRWSHAGYIFLFENPDHRFEFRLRFG